MHGRVRRESVDYGAVDGLPLALSDGLAAGELAEGDSLRLGALLAGELGAAVGETTGSDGRVGLGDAEGLQAASAATRPPTMRMRLNMAYSRT